MGTKPKDSARKQRFAHEAQTLDTRTNTKPFKMNGYCTSSPFACKVAEDKLSITIILSLLKAGALGREPFRCAGHSQRAAAQNHDPEAAKTTDWICHGARYYRTGHIIGHDIDGLCTKPGGLDTKPKKLNTLQSKSRNKRHNTP